MVFSELPTAILGPASKTLPYFILAGIIAYYVISSIQSYWRLRHIPGPPLAAFTSLWWIRATNSGEGHLALADVCTNYGMDRDLSTLHLECLTRIQGSIARIGPNTVVTSDEDLVRKMNAFRGSTYTRSKWYKGFKLDADRENLFTELDEQKHLNLRNRVTIGVSLCRQNTC
jgi:hypothetical protein